MKEINLTHDKVALVDDEDFEYLNQFKWHIQKSGDTFYAVRTLWIDKFHGTTIRMHRFLLGVNDKLLVVDHKDHNGLNNQRYNLRVCSKSQNGANRKKSKPSSSKYLGVHYCNTRGLWVVQIQHNNKSYSGGLHKTEELAALAYNKKAIELHGDFANINII